MRMSAINPINLLTTSLFKSFYLDLPVNNSKVWLKTAKEKYNKAFSIKLIIYNVLKILQNFKKNRMNKKKIFLNIFKSKLFSKKLLFLMTKFWFSFYTFLFKKISYKDFDKKFVKKCNIVNRSNCSLNNFFMNKN